MDNTTHVVSKHYVILIKIDNENSLYGIPCYNIYLIQNITKIIMLTIYMYTITLKMESVGSQKYQEKIPTNFHKELNRQDAQLHSPTSLM